ncbi:MULTISPECIES: FMN-dependent NADH-azoreductase [Aneurinibacillus]|uniref:FMN dependent NADH:quinone oxidoreductase n=1 Tax=Aneurinibacillus thermoaerophilus TaxID=143495 RepID=A0A1G8A6L4_ANETH|nr:MULTISPECIES: FMN-dependent NADH-azoreductase [Aneurinibacillus]AMA74085.1 FMN-dependent NADH-azoreductase [Aneurinibacillus sp. XH2]MED0678814.1 FMN-dependent NADH-azoreductase [Aneurinibacillus thermoaerophilus]MED0736687.1 FMN-dependent NADH-azoreductase [Aneurinibacillus thermoaerophilus]MED0758342.1 FMN-dependent NADH-azoreductase [Aneurinibacillus thermoaerophilus]MED0759851.1 FMN-dependent NADH-azoreductase [Aneurinibacillus thermoaerophilus]
MAKVLYITANPKPVEASYGLRLGETFLKAYQQHNPTDTIERLDLYKEEIPFIDALVLNAWDKVAKNEALNDEEKRVLGRMTELLDQFIAADKVIFVTPLWNLSYPPLLKAYIDNVVIAGKTFKYTEQGPQGLMAGKRVMHIQARGGVYSEGPAVDFEFTDKYLRGIMGFIGITDYTHIFVEGMAATPDKAEEIFAKAEHKAREAAVEFAKNYQRT